MSETFYATFTIPVPRLNWPKNCQVGHDSKSPNKFTIYASVGGPLKAAAKSSICTEWLEIQEILEEQNNEN